MLYDISTLVAGLARSALCICSIYIFTISRHEIYQKCIISLRFHYDFITISLRFHTVWLCEFAHSRTSMNSFISLPMCVVKALSMKSYKMYSYAYCESVSYDFVDMMWNPCLWNNITFIHVHIAKSYLMIS